MIERCLIKIMMRYLVKSLKKRRKKKKIKKISICLGLPANRWLNIPKIGFLSLSDKNYSVLFPFFRLLLRPFLFADSGTAKYPRAR